jgi:hypothetical protein
MSPKNLEERQHRDEEEAAAAKRSSFLQDSVYQYSFSERSDQVERDDSTTKNSETTEISLSDLLNPSSPCQNLHILAGSSSSLLAVNNPEQTTPTKRRIALLAIDLQNDFLGDHDDSFYFNRPAVLARGGSCDHHPFTSRRQALLERIEDLSHQVRALGGGE